MTEVKTEELVSAYITLREERAALKEQYEKKDNELKSDMEKLELALLDICNGVGASSIKTTHGTVIRRLSERYYCSDWENFVDFVKDNDAIQLLERRIHQSNFKEFMSEHEGDGLPPGVSVIREYGVTIRKSSSVE